MGPFGKCNKCKYHRDLKRQVKRIHVVGHVHHTGNPENMNQYPCHGNHKKQENEYPIAVMGKLEYLFLFPESADKIVDAGKHETESDIVSQPPLGMGNGMNFICLKPTQEKYNEAEHNYIAGHDQPVTEPVCFTFAFGEFPLGNKIPECRSDLLDVQP